MPEYESEQTRILAFLRSANTEYFSQNTFIFW